MHGVNLPHNLFVHIVLASEDDCCTLCLHQVSITFSSGRETKTKWREQKEEGWELGRKRGVVEVGVLERNLSSTCMQNPFPFGFFKIKNPRGCVIILQVSI